MPRTAPVVSYTQIRNYAEKFSWLDPKTKRRVVGYEVPKDAIDLQRVPFHIKWITLKGKTMEADAITLEVNTGLHMRNLGVLDQEGNTHGDGIWVYDMFILEIDGVRFQNH